MHTRYAVEKINDQTDLLNSSRLSAQIEKIPPQDSFHASKRGEWTSRPFLDYSGFWFIVLSLISNIIYFLKKYHFKFQCATCCIMGLPRFLVQSQGLPPGGYLNVLMFEYLSLPNHYHVIVHSRSGYWNFKIITSS